MLNTIDELVPDKLTLGNFPTPIQYLEALSDEINCKIYLKREDYSGIELTGNKIRKLEFSLQDAISLKSDTIITTGAIQSNHCRATAAACARLGLECHLVLRGELTDIIEGNLFYNLALGAHVHLISPSSNAKEKMLEICKSLKQNGRNPYLIPVGASNAVGSQGFCSCYKEIIRQETSMGINFDIISLAVGSGGTIAGLCYENGKHHSSKEIIGFSVSDTSAEFRVTIDEIIDQMAKLENNLERPNLRAYDYTLNDQYVGLGYAQSTTAEVTQILEVAQKTGVIFDPCYTGKAFLGLMSEIRKGNIDRNKNILFIHTGGLFGWTNKTRNMALSKLNGRLNNECNIDS